ncbi:hypothetical protein EAI_01286 [Harpegnathos saltator]|uniref:Uncharacterized protein n=1 Tax=Harpegnathos saltator TaxID=610380 RepID=E2B8K8_HARSA|nr:hypothetical protein EAI_01286 [Harpegnathos saltator]
MPPGVGIAKLNAYGFEASAYLRLMCVVKSHILPEVPLSRPEKVYNKIHPVRLATYLKYSRTMLTTLELKPQNMDGLHGQRPWKWKTTTSIYALYPKPRKGAEELCDNYILVYNRKDKNGAATSGVSVLFYGRYEANINIEYNSDGILTVTEHAFNTKAQEYNMLLFKTKIKRCLKAYISGAPTSAPIVGQLVEEVEQLAVQQYLGGASPGWERKLKPAFLAGFPLPNHMGRAAFQTGCKVIWVSSEQLFFEIFGSNHCSICSAELKVVSEIPSDG